MAQPVISIILPVFNVSAYLERCLDSLLAQTFTDFEIIAINDGSTDNSLDILKSYLPRMPTMTVIDQQNKGLGETRNIALERAKGTFIYCVDSDDYLLPGCLKTIAREMQQSSLDALFFSTQMEFLRELSHTDQLSAYYQRPRAMLNKVMSAEDFFNGCIHARKTTGNGYSVVVWGYAFRRLSYETLRFQSRCYEDEYFTTQLLLGQPQAKVKCLADRLYVHSLGGSSITTTTPQIKRALAILDTLRLLLPTAGGLTRLTTVKSLCDYADMLYIDAIFRNFAVAQAAFPVQKMIRYLAGSLHDLYLNSPSEHGLTLLYRIMYLLAKQGEVLEDPDMAELLEQVRTALANKKHLLAEYQE
jgi:glycosyltransferase involved in cell wall biosynthesis